MALAFAVVSSSASAETRKALWTTCEVGTAAGQCQAPRGIAANPTTGDIYVGDQLNNRIDVFTAWGEFVMAWGWGVRTGAEEAQMCTSATGCLVGKAGAKEGQLSSPSGMALDSAGNVYVAEFSNHRVQKFSPSGEFLLMFGGEVDKTTGADICTKADVALGDECGAGTTGEADGQFGAWAYLGSFLSIGPGDRVYVGDKERVEVFTAEGVFVEDIANTAFEGQNFVQSLSVDSAGDLYVAFGKETFRESKPNVYKLDGSHKLTCTLGVKNPRAITTDAGKNVYVVEKEGSAGRPKSRILVYSSSCAQTESFGEGELTAPTALATNVVTTGGDIDVYVGNSNSTAPGSFVRAYGLGPDKWPPPKKPPTIVQQFAVSADDDAAVTKAVVNPHFWADTTYYVEYGTGKCDEGGCPERAPVPASTLTSEVVDEAIPTAGVTLAGLQPGTMYHYRFVAESSGGGPVFGVAPEGGEASFAAGLEGTFTTPSPTLPPKACPNQVFRLESGASLPDCRAYEMVSPVDKSGGEVIALLNNANNPVEFDQAAVGGGRFAYSSYSAFGETESAPYASQYLATRGAGGWSNQGVSPPRGRTLIAIKGLDTQYKAFSADLASGWLLYDSDRELAPGAVHDFANFYRRDDETGAYEPLIPVEPPHREPVEFVPELQGVSAGGTTAIFTANDQLAQGAPELSSTQVSLYEASGGSLRYVCVLPGETPFAGPCTAGTINNQLPEGRNNSVDHAISSDGSRIFWTAFGGLGGPGRIYVRIEGKETLPVSEAGETLSGGTGSQYLTAAADGSKAIFATNNGDLYEFSVAGEVTQLVAHKFKGMLAASDDASRIYFISEEAITGEEENEQGDKAQAAKPNLYLYRAAEEGKAATYTFVATLSAADAKPQTLGKITSPVNLTPILHTAQATPSGSDLVFMSSGQPTHYDNADVQNGEADAEVYRYDAADGSLACLSCHGSGARPSGEEVAGLWTASRIPGWQTQLYAPRALTGDGSRAFFDSYEALTSRDTDGREDVYEWERADGARECEEAGAERYEASSGGCLSLISSGDSTADSEFVDASGDGTDAFFKTVASLVRQDPGLFDVYDARAGGGFPPPPETRAACEGTACQSPSPPPVPPTPASAAFTGPGNLRQHLRCRRAAKRAAHGSARRRCRHGRRHRRRARAHRRGRRAGR